MKNKIFIRAGGPVGVGKTTLLRKIFVLLKEQGIEVRDLSNQHQLLVYFDTSEDYDNTPNTEKKA